MTCNGRQRQPRGLRCRRAHVARAANPCLPRISELEDFCPTSVRRLNVSFYATLLKCRLNDVRPSPTDGQNAYNMEWVDRRNPPPGVRILSDWGEEEEI